MPKRTIFKMKKNSAHIGALFIVLCTIVRNVNSYSKYGRGCGDIGCLPNEVCVMAHDSCNLGQRDGKECGSYPTCTKTGSSGASKTNPGMNLNPSPDNTRLSQSTNNNPPSNNVINSYNSNPTPINPHYVFGAPQSQQPPIYPNVPIFPHYQPTSPPQFQQFPQANHPNYPSYPGQIAPRTPSNSFNPSYIFGHQPNYFNPQATTKAPSFFHQNLYNKQDRSHYRNSAFSTIYLDRFNRYSYNIISSFISFLIVFLLSFNFHLFDIFS